MKGRKRAVSQERMNAEGLQPISETEIRSERLGERQEGRHKERQTGGEREVISCLFKKHFSITFIVTP